MKKLMMIAVMAVCCLTANAQKMRHDAGSITIQPMIGFSVGTWRGETSGTTSTSNDARVGLAIGAEGEYYTTTDWLSISAAVKYEQLGWKFKDVDAAKLDYINIPVMANFYVAKGFALKVGLQPGFLVNAKHIHSLCCRLRSVTIINEILSVGLTHFSKCVHVEAGQRRLF